MDTPEFLEDYFKIEFKIDDDDLIIALFEQGLDSLENFNLLTLADMTRVCDTIRKPGGMIVDDDGDLVPNRGQAVSAVLEKRLKQFWQYVRYAYMTQRTPDFLSGDGVPDLADLHNLDSYIKSFKLPSEVPKPPSFPGISGARKWFERFDNWAEKCLGPSGVPLLYVLRMKSDIDDDDPGWYEPSLKDDLALRGPHGAADNMFWREDNAAVWDMLANCLHPTKEYAHIKTFAKKADGHAAYVSLKESMLGPSITKSLEAIADNVIRTVKYTGKGSFTFDRLVTMMIQGFIDCGTEYSDYKKVDMLLKAIHDPSLSSVKLNVRSSKDLKNNFHETVAFIQEHLAERTDYGNKGDRNVATTSTSSSTSNSKSGRGRGKSGSGKSGKSVKGGLAAWDPKNPAAYYSPKAWRAMTKAQRQLHFDAKAAKNSGGGGNYNAQIKALNEKVAALTSNLEAAQAVAEHQSIGAAISGKRKRDS
jgi:hypothetical protein